MEPELESICNDWMDEDWVVRRVSVNRGHWEQLLPVIENYYETVIIPERIKQAKRELIEKMEQFLYNYSGQTPDECETWWQQLKKEEGIG
jgi:hypothetical protein